jgi:hypothetical protein
VVAQAKTADDIRSWLPGARATNYQMQIPAVLAAGQYSIDVAMLDGQGKSRINLANEGKQSDGWYRISKFRVE